MLKRRSAATLFVVGACVAMLAGCGAGEPTTIRGASNLETTLAETAVPATEIYRWTAGFVIIAEETVVADDMLTIAVDRARDVALIDIDYSRLPEHLRPKGSENAAVAFVDGTALTRGAGLAPIDTGTDSWYLDDTIGDGDIPDILGEDASIEAVRAALGSSHNDPAASIRLSASEVDELRQGTNLIGGLARADLELSQDLIVELESDALGRLATARLTFADGDAQITVTITLDYDATPFVVPTIADAVELPPPSEPELVTIEREAVEPHRGALVRLNVYLGNDIDVSLTPEGSLVRVGRTDVFAGPEDFVFWQLSPVGVERLIAAIEANPAVASGTYNIAFPVGVALDVGQPPSELNAHPDNEPDTVDYSTDVNALIDLMSDPTWLGDDVLAGPDPWVPGTLTVVATPGMVSQPLDWPFDHSIRDMGFDSTIGDGGVVVCLVGDEVDRVWELLGGGLNHAHLPFYDGEFWDANVWLNWPGYRLYADPCGDDVSAGE